MFNFFAKKTATNQRMIKLKIKGMHCVSCALSIDNTLEDLPGVTSVNTNYARAIPQVIFDPQQVVVDQIQAAILELGYETEIHNP